MKFVNANVMSVFGLAGLCVLLGMVSAERTEITVAHGLVSMEYDCTSADIIEEVESQFNGAAVTQDAKTGLLYVTSGSGCTVTSYNQTSHQVVVVAGSPSCGFVDNVAATSAEMEQSFGLAVNGQGDLFIADFENNRVRKVSASTKLMSTVVGTGSGVISGFGGAATSAGFSNPVGLYLDSVGNMYVSSFDNAVVARVDAAGTITAFAGTVSNGYTGNGGQATSAKIALPYGITSFMDGSIAFVDQFNKRVRKVSPSGIISTYAGSGSTAYNGEFVPATSANLNAPSGVSVDPFDGTLYVTSSSNQRVQAVSYYGNIMTTAAGNGTFASTGNGGRAVFSTLKNPVGIFVNTGGEVYIQTYDQLRVIT